MEIRSLGLLTPAVIAMVTIDAFYKPLLFGGARLFPVFYSAVIAPNADGLNGIAALIKLATIVLFCMWIHRAGRNLIAFGFDALEFTPGARIWWFAVPIANLFVPYQGMRELWNASHGRQDLGHNEPIVAIWWGLWLLHGVAAAIAMFFTRGDDQAGFRAQGVADVALALVAIQMLREIVAAQARLRGPELARVFA